MISDIPPPFDAAWFRAFIGVPVGAALGSFVTMLSYRLPLKRSIVTPPSSCPHCHHNLAARDLIPIFSWVLSRGKCRYCGVAISPRYPLIELAMACGSAAAFALIGVQPWLFVILLGLVIVATVMTICIENARD